MAVKKLKRSYEVQLKLPHPRQQQFIDSTTKRKIIRAGRRGGKTTGIAIFAVKQFLEHGRRVLYATPTGDQISRFWSEVTNALSELVADGVLRKNETEHFIEKPGTEQRIRAKTAWNADTLRGDYADVLIMDEWQLMNEDAWAVVGAPMLIDNNGDAVFIYTPPSQHTRSVIKADDPRHASKMYARALEEMQLAEKEGRKPRWEAFHFSSLDNPYLSSEGLAEVTRDMTQLAYRQEILAEESDEAPGALWKRATLDAGRVRIAPDFTRLVIGVDPPGGATECGIVAVGAALCSCKGTREVHGFVIEDASMKAGPDEWSRAVASLYDERGANLVVGEKNYGGDMVRHTIWTAGPQIHYKDVQATRGKAVRAEPIAALYEQGKVHHIGVFDDLEEEMCNWIPGIGMDSPNRLDAMVWAFTEIYPELTYLKGPKEPLAKPTPEQLNNNLVTFARNIEAKFAKQFDRKTKTVGRTYF